MGEIVIKDGIYYTEEEYKEVKEEQRKKEYALRDEIKRKIKKGEKVGGIAAFGFEEPIFIGPTDEALRFKEPPKTITIWYVDCLAGSIIIFAIGLGFLLLAKRPSRTKGGETEKI